MSDPHRGPYMGMPTYEEWGNAQDALDLAETVAATAIRFIETVAAGGEWKTQAHDLNNKIYDFRKARLS